MSLFMTLFTVVVAKDSHAKKNNIHTKYIDVYDMERNKQKQLAMSSSE